MTSDLPKYQQISRMIVGMIQSGEFDADDRVFSISEIRKRFSVSMTTAQRVLSELEQSGYVIRRKGAGTFLNRSGNGGGAPRTWGYVMPAINKPSLYVHVIRGIENAAHEQNINLIVANSDDDPEKQDAVLQRMLDSSVDGVIITPHLHPYTSYGMYLKLISHHVPFVFCIRDVSGINAPLVTADHKKGGYLGTRHLLDAGFRRIGFVSPTRTYVSSERFGGYLEALQEAGIEPREEQISWMNYSFEELYAKLRSEARNLLQARTRPEAFFCVSDMTAYALYDAMSDLGLKCPEDIALVGHDDIDPPRGTNLRLTSVAYPAYASGRACADLLMRMHGGEKLGADDQIILEPTLKIRQSCGEKRETPQEAEKTGA